MTYGYAVRGPEPLEALSDPTRRQVLELLRGGERSVSELTAAMSVSQPAVSQHLKVLRGARLVTVRPQGRRRMYSVDLDGLSAVRAWLDTFWDDALAAFADYANDPANRPANDPAVDPNRISAIVGADDESAGKR